MNYADMNQYLTPEQAAKLAGVEDPELRMTTMTGMQRFANNMPEMNRIKERSANGVVGRTSPLEGLAQMGSQMAGAYMNKNLMDRYGAIMDANNKSRVEAAIIMAKANALRNAKPGMPQSPASANPYSAESFAVEPYAPAQYTTLDPM